MADIAKVLDTWEPVIGLEVHIQLNTESKIFCGCSTKFGAEPNSHTCPVCLGHPGVLPVLNRKVVDFAITLGLALGCEIRPRSVWARKNYFYPDLPKGYQISQYELPICEHGRLTFEVEEGTPTTVGITRIHMEEDAGKNTHVAGANRSLVDLNRAGVPLLEMVSEPDLRHPAEAPAYLKTLRSIVRYLGISDGNLQEGSLRCDANVSLRRRGTEAFGTRTETKNLNSFRFVQKALEYEIVRQAALLENGEAVVQETRLYDSDRDETRPMRSKEEANDYRYFPEPDLPPLMVDTDWVRRIADELPELALPRARRFEEAYGISAYDARVLTAERDVADWFEAACAAYEGEGKKVGNWMQTEVLRELNERGGSLGDLKVTPESLAALLRLVDDGKISGSAGKEVFASMAESGKAPDVVVAEKGLTQVSDTGKLEAIIDEVLEANPKEVEAYKGGKTALVGFFMGQVMKASKGKANPKVVQKLLREKLGG